MKSRIIVILDRSGSMVNILQDTIGGFSAYLKTLREDLSGSDTETVMTMVQFDSGGIDTVYKDLPLAEVPELQLEPRGNTPLIEAMHRTITAAIQNEKGYSATVVVTITDGEENWSAPEFTNSSLESLISRKKEDGWTFIFLGAGIDAYKQAQSIGVGVGQTMSYDSRDTVATVSSYAASGKMSARGACGQSVGDFTEQERKSAGDAYYPKKDKMQVDL